MKKKLFALIVVSFFVVFLSGCIEYTANFYVNLDGTGILDVVYVVNKSLLATVVKERMGNTNFLPLSKEGVEKYYAKKKGVKLLKVNFKDVGPQTLRIHIRVSFENPKYLNDQQMQYWWGIEGGRYVFKIHIKKVGYPSKNNPIIEKAIKEAMSKYYVTFNIHLPRRIVESNADEIDWNTATWKISIYEMTHMREPKNLYAAVKAKWNEILSWKAKQFWGKIKGIFR